MTTLCATCAAPLSGKQKRFCSDGCRHKFEAICRQYGEMLIAARVVTLRHMQERLYFARQKPRADAVVRKAVAEAR